MASRYWSCAGCGARWERTIQKCRTEGCNRSRPKRRIPAHAVALRDVPYSEYVRLNDLIHAAGETCGVCGRPPTDARNLDRDHGHDRAESSYGKPRGLACPGDWGCNKVMSRLTLERARLVVAYLERVEAWYREEAAA